MLKTTRLVRKRGKGKIKSGKTLEDSYEVAKDHFGLEISRSEYKRIAYAINKRIMQGLRDGEEFTMPYRLGSLKVGRRKVNLNNLRIDFKEFNRTGKKVKHLNEHTDGYYFYYKWDRTTAEIRNHFFYSFIITRANKKSLISLLKTGSKGKRDYFE